MKSATAGLITLLNSRSFVMADLYEFTLRSGTVVRYTSADIDVVYSGNTYSSVGPRLKRGRTKIVLGIEVDELNIEVFPRSTDLLNGTPFLQALRSGALDGARLVLRRAFKSSWSDSATEAMIQFSGRVSEMELSRFGAQIQVKSDTELLNVQMPRNLYQPTCLNTLYDSNCGVVKATYEVTGQVTAGSTQSSLNTNLSGYPNGWFSLGTIEFLSGANSGVKKSVREFLSGVVSLTVPLVGMPVAGDTFKILPGCNKLQSTCGNTVERVFTANHTTNVFACTGHRYGNGTRVLLTNTGGALPSPLNAGTIYYTVNVTDDTFQLSTAYNGSPVDITNNGTGTHKVRNIGKFDNLAKFRAFPYVPKPETAL